MKSSENRHIRACLLKWKTVSFSKRTLAFTSYRKPGKTWKMHTPVNTKKWFPNSKTF